MDPKLRNYCFKLKELIEDEKKAWEADYPIVMSIAEDLGYREDFKLFKKAKADEIKHWTWAKDIYKKRCPRGIQTEI